MSVDGGGWLFNVREVVAPGAAVQHGHKLPLDSPRRFEWFFKVEDAQQARGSTRALAAPAVEFWCEALWVLEEGGNRTDVIYPRRGFPANQLHSDFKCVYDIDGRASVQFWWRNLTATPLRVSFTVTGTRLRTMPQVGAVMTKDEERSQLETRVVQEVDTALMAVHEIIAHSAPDFSEVDMRTILFAEFGTAQRGECLPEKWNFLGALASCALSRRGSAEEFAPQSSELDKLIQGTQGWRYFVHKKMEDADDVRWFEDGARLKLESKRPEAVSKLRRSMAASQLRASEAMPGSRCSMKASSVSMSTSFRMTEVSEAHPPECVCQKMKPKASALFDVYFERRITIEGVSLNVYEKDDKTGAWDVKPRGSSLKDLMPNFMEERKCTVVHSETKFRRGKPWSGNKKLIVVYTPLDGQVALESGAFVPENQLPSHFTADGGGGRFAFADQTEFNKFWAPLLNLSEGRPWDCSRAKALRHMLTRKVEWWSVKEVEEWVSLLGLQRWPQDMTFCTQQAVRNCSIDGSELLELSRLPQTHAVETLSSYLDDTAVARRSRIDTVELAEILLAFLAEQIRPLAEDQAAQLLPKPEPEPEPGPEPEPEPNLQSGSKIAEAIVPPSTRVQGPKHVADGLAGMDTEPQPQPDTKPEPEPEPELEWEPEPEPEPSIDPEEVEAQLQLVLSQTPAWSVLRFDRYEQLPAKITTEVQQKFQAYKRTRGQLDDGAIEARLSLATPLSAAPMHLAVTMSKRYVEATVPQGTINFEDMVIRTPSSAGTTRTFPIRYFPRKAAEVKDAKNFCNRRVELAKLCTSESYYVTALSTLREICFAPVEEKVAEKHSRCGPFPQCRAFAALLSLHTDFAAQLRGFPSPLPMAEEARELQMLTEYFEKMRPVWAEYLQYERKDILQMLSVAAIEVNESQLSSLIQKSTERIVELYVLIKKMSQMDPPEQLHSVQERLQELMDTCGTHPSITAQQQLHLPLSSPLTGTVVPNCCLWLLPVGFDKLIGHMTWDRHQLRRLGGLRHKYWTYGNLQDVRDRVTEAKRYIHDAKRHVLCLILLQDKSVQRQSTSSQVDEDAATLPEPYSGLDEHCSVFSQHNLDDIVAFFEQPTVSARQVSVKNVLSDCIREVQAEAFDKQALTILARGKTEFEHVFELEEWDGKNWLPSRKVETKRGLLRKVVDSGPSGGNLEQLVMLQDRIMFSLSASELKWGDGRIDVAQITGVHKTIAWDKDLDGHGFEVHTNAPQATTVHRFLADKMDDRDAWLASIDKILQAQSDQDQRLKAFCREDFAFRDSPEDLLLPVEKDAQWVFVGEWGKMPWEYSPDALRWKRSSSSSDAHRRRKWWCFKQLLTGESFNKVDPRNKDWAYVKRLEAVQDTLTELASNKEGLSGQDYVDFANATIESLESVLSTDDDRGHHEIAAWFLRTLTTAMERWPQIAAKVLHMVIEVVNSQRFNTRHAALQQLSSLLRCEIDPMLLEQVIDQDRSLLASDPVLSLAQECTRVFRESKIQLPQAKHCDEGNLLRVHELLAKLARDPHRRELSPRECHFLWTHRNAEFLHQDDRMLSKLLLATPDWNVDGPEAATLLGKWKPLTPLGALALLDDRFWWAAKTRFVTSYEDPKACNDEAGSFRPFRSYAVKCLACQDGWTDRDFCRYMLQMAVVLRTQMHSFDLVQLLLQRALRSPETVGHALYWHVRAEMCRALADMKNCEGEGMSASQSSVPGDTPAEVFARLAIILRTYLNLCPSESREALLNQEMHLVYPLKQIAKKVKQRSPSMGIDELKMLMQNELQTVKIEGEMALPVAPETRVTAVVPEDSFVLKSATKALMLRFNTTDGGRLNVIFKDGDDLRQDELVLQAFELMQEWWTKATCINTQVPPLLNDGSLSIYHVSDLGGDVGMITPVANSYTLASIFSEHIQRAELELEGGWLEKIPQVNKIIDAVRSQPEVLHEWIQKHRGNVSEETARRNFMHSCAGYCVATFILGLGDRHSSNIMLQEDGHLVHIDFGWWLGHNPKRPPVLRRLFELVGASVDYDDDGFAFVPSFAYIIVGPDVWHDEHLKWRQSARFAEFTQLCCECYKVVRNNAHDFINLFSVMVAADIGEEVADRHGGGDMKLNAKALESLREYSFRLLPVMSYRAGSSSHQFGDHHSAYPERCAGNKFRLDVEDAVAADWFQGKIDAALSDKTSNALLTNWVLNTLGQTI